MPDQGSWDLNQQLKKQRRKKSEAQIREADLVKGQDHTCMLGHINTFEMSLL